MAFSSGNDSGGPMAEINVTPLVDVMLVLLIIFMITTPLMNHKVKVKLPEVVVEKKEETKQPIPPITIAVTEAGALFLNDEPTTKQAIESRLSVEAQKTPQPPVQLPEATLDQKPEKDKVPPVTIAVTERGELFWNDEPSTRQLIESKLSVEAQKDPQPVINIRADKTTKYRLVNDVVKVAQAQGMRKVGFITTPPKKGQ